MKKKPNRRKKFLVNPRFQINFLLYTAGIALLTLNIFFAANRYFFNRSEEFISQFGEGEQAVLVDFMLSQQHNMTLILILTSLICLLLTMLTGLYLSNRIAGPVYRCQEYLKDFRQGKKAGPLKFRDGDYFKELAEEINQTLEKQ